MFGSDILDMAIGLVFVFLLLSLVCTAVRELIESLLKQRACDLERGLIELLGDGLTEKVYEHPLVFGLFQGKTYKEAKGRLSDCCLRRWLGAGGTLPSYIPSKTFALALLDTVLPPTDSTNTSLPGRTKSLQALQQAVGAKPQQANAAKPQGAEEKAYGALLTLVDVAGADLVKLREGVETWFNNSMERVTGWYKRRTQAILLCLAAVLAVGMNVDTIVIAKRLYQDSTLRKIVVSQAEAVAKQKEPPKADLQQREEQLQGLGLPIGWSDVPLVCPLNPAFHWWDWVFSHLLGWSITALAISLGAPFWFDVLSKFMAVRGSIKPEAGGPGEAPKAPPATGPTLNIAPPKAAP